MSDTNIILKSRISEVLETLNLIILLYTIFLVVLGLFLHNSEVILQTCIMFVVYIIFEYINYDIVKIANKGISCEKYGFLAWQDMYVVRKKERTIFIYSKTRSKPYKLIMKKTEDNTEIERAYKYIISKVKAPDKIKPEKIVENL
ncbi:MAG: hypothetical protein IJ629_01085 [Clostridia bacterium]|nr:hypothetical protein [Clostridia bacterium]